MAQQTSLYLQQHAHHPVDWYPWGEEALNKARQENKPILLSIGYSACHWCHVMAHESFADAATAEIMNAHFVNIKVDREERPDLDKIYQAAHHLLSNSAGGWPLTLFLSPQDQLPFFSGTYFPKTPRYGMPSFIDILQRVEHFYHSEQSRELTAQNQRLAHALQQIYQYPSQAPNPPETALIEQAVGELSQQFDTEWGGFGHPPKFPHPTTLDFLLHLAQQPEALKMALQTLQQMASSGIHDQLLGGFYRYSTDERWMIPHFEKMLCDNGLLLSSYTQAFRITGQPLFAQTANVIANWAIRTMQSPQGAFYASLDADSEGQEGKFYLWDRSEVQRLLAPVDFEIFALRYGLNRKPNFEGYWHLHGLTGFEEIAQLLQISHETITQSLHHSIQVLYKAREQRVHPVRDEKILTAWNALMIRGLAQAAFTLNQLTYADAATEALNFIHEHLWQNGRLLATYKDGHARVMAYVDDYAYLIAAILDLLQVRWNSQHLAFAVQLADVLLEQFEDKQQGGFWFTAHDHETLIQRPKITADDALPAGNSMAAQSLLRLGALTGNIHYIEAAQRALQAGFAIAAHGASQHAALLKTSLENLNPSDVLIVRYPAGRMSDTWYAALQQLSNPYTQVYAIPNEETDLPPTLAEKRPLAETTLYQCRGMMCAPPITDLAQCHV